MPQAPTTRGTFADLPDDPAARAEALLGVFGEHLFSARNQALDLVRGRVESEDARAALGRLRSAVYAAVAALPPDAREAALALTGQSADLFLQILLHLFGAGPACRELGFGPGHAVTYRVVLEVRDGETGEVVEAADVNRAGRRFLGEYFGRWLNQLANHR